MKNTTSFLVSLFFLLLSYSTPAQERVELKTLAQELRISVKDSFAIIDLDGNLDTFKVSKKADERTYTFRHTIDKSRFENLLKVDKGEIKNKYENAFPGVDPMEQLISKAASISNGILLASKEAGGIPAGSIDEIGGKKPAAQGSTKSETDWMMVLIANAIGLIVGLVVATFFRKKQTPPAIAAATHSEEEINFEETIAPVKNDAKKVTDAAKTKISKLQADKKSLIADNKNLQSELGSVQSQLSQHTQFHKTVLGNLMKETISPMNDALEKNNQSEAAAQLLRLAAYTTSIARHELGIKQAYDSVNIALLLKQQLPPNLNIETITENTPPDRIPNNLHNILQFMKNNGASQLGTAVLFGYKIA